MPYGLHEHIYIAQFRNELLLLDAKKDTYIILASHYSDLLLSILGQEYSLLSSSKPAGDREEDILKLLRANILRSTDDMYPYYIDLKSDAKGIPNIDWILPSYKQKSMNRHVAQALKVLIFVRSYIKCAGFNGTLKFLKKSRKPEYHYIIPPAEELITLAHVINKACHIYPSRTKCLEWALTYVLCALKKGWKCNLEIGVQNYPFAAHAWVECGERVVMDSQYLREGLAIILCEPFRKLKV